MEVRPVDESDRPWVESLLREHWGATVIVTRGRLHDAACLQGFVALCGGERVGLITCRIEGDSCEVVSLNSLREGRGIGSALVETVRGLAAEAGCRRLWLVTTNDNVAALRFWQKRGFALVAVHRNAITRSRCLKPQIPLVGQHGIPVRDEIELEIVLQGDG